MWRPIPIAVSLAGLGLCLRAHATLDAEGPLWWREGLTAHQAALQARYPDPTESTARLLAAEIEPGVPGHAIHAAGVVLLVAGGAAAALRRTSR